jgi:hypothetical protein
MKKTHKKSSDTELRPEYDFAGGVRGKYAERFSAGSNIVVLDPDVAEAFPSSESANEALRGVMKSKKRDSVQTAQTQ